MNMQDRAKAYVKANSIYDPLHVDGKGRLYGTWITGNNYRGSGYHGAYPPGYLQRVMALFPDRQAILHLFSGSLAEEQSGERFEVTFDLNRDMAPTVVGDAHRLSTYFAPHTFDLVLADPPYTHDDAVKYAKIRGEEKPEKWRKPHAKKILEEAHRVVKPGGFVVWLDTAWPMHSKKLWDWVGYITLIRSTNHAVRLVSIFQKVGS